MKDQIDKVDNIDQKDLFRKKGKYIKDRIPSLITYNRKLMPEIINKHWDVLQINPELQETFQNSPFVVFKRSKNLHEIIGHMIKNEKSVSSTFKKQKREM